MSGPAEAPRPPCRGCGWPVGDETVCSRCTTCGWFVYEAEACPLCCGQVCRARPPVAAGAPEKGGRAP